MRVQGGDFRYRHYLLSLKQLIQTQLHCKNSSISLQVYKLRGDQNSAFQTVSAVGGKTKHLFPMSIPQSDGWKMERGAQFFPSSVSHGLQNGQSGTRTVPMQKEKSGVMVTALQKDTSSLSQSRKMPMRMGRVQESTCVGFGWVQAMIEPFLKDSVHSPFNVEEESISPRCTSALATPTRQADLPFTSTSQ